MKRRFVLFWILILVLLLLVVLYLPSFSRYQELQMEEGRITEEIAELERKIALLEREKGLLQNDKKYLEKVIRDELGLVRPGEMIYKLVPESSSPGPKAREPETD